MMTEKKDRTVDYKRTVINGPRHDGKHPMTNLKSCNDRLSEGPSNSEFPKSRVPKIDMTAFGEPIVARLGEGIEEGISGVQPVITGAITAHTNDTARNMYLDVFSCKWFDEGIVRDVVNSFFSPEEITEQIILRS